MRKLFLHIGGWLSLFFGLAEVCFAVGESNPTGVTGDYNGSVATAGSYDPFTGNAKRVVTDLTVTGSVGAYPLKWTRTLNTRGGWGWSGSYGWSLWTRLNGPGFYDNEYEGPQGEIDYPDGRRMTLVNADTDVWMIQNSGHEPMDRLQHMGNGNYDLIMRDGGRVRFVADGPPVTG